MTAKVLCASNSELQETASREAILQRMDFLHDEVSMGNACYQRTQDCMIALTVHSPLHLFLYTTGGIFR